MFGFFIFRSCYFENDCACLFWILSDIFRCFLLICRLFLFSARWMMDVENEKSAVSWALIFDCQSEMATKLSFELVLDPSVRPYVGSRAWGSSKMYLL